MQRFVDGVLAVSKESVKTITYESLNNIVRLVNGVSALLLTFLPGKANILEGMNGWELRPTFSGPRLPRWMEHGVSSFNQFVHNLSVDPDAFSSSDYSSGEEDINEYSCPSPLSQSSRFSRASSFSRHERHGKGWMNSIFSLILFPVKLLLAILARLLFFPFYRKVRASPSERQKPSSSISLKRVQTLKDYVFQRTTDRRRGVIEDLHLAMEIFIEAIFDIVHKAAHCLLSPAEVSKMLYGWIFSHNTVNHNNDVVSESSVTTATLGENDPALSESKTSFHHSLNTDTRTCQDVITELGRDARKAVYLQHGILDSSMGWVSNGVVGSPAFAAYDQGFDVFLGNFRGLVSREHVNKSISSRQYWQYSINEHGTHDIPAMINKIHEVKTSELKLSQPDGEEESNEDQPYKLCAICHSLGGAAMLMYLITSQIEEKPRRLSRLILLSPGGFHGDSNLAFTLVENLLLVLAPILAPLVPAFYIPTRFFRLMLNKLARDFINYPAVGGLVQTLMSYVVGGDSSNWVGVLGLPHYNMNDMPGLSFRVALHLAQLKRSGKFKMYDYGSASANKEAYGSMEPLDLGEHYGLIDIPVDLVAGRKDKVIRPSMVRNHYRKMKESRVDVSYSEFEYAHLDFTFSHREELLAYVMSHLLLVVPGQKHQLSQKAMKLKRKGQVSS
ncbi:uncharacterized protein LOC115676704 isoform X2 [Syzygium oleosum]|uniref:uncharacterized protein LOC115676704 isoform X2 n=1 Tax=Syzygium oleosum TaxID=219896 RepID=UPI0024BBE7E9|nr:uncharacterized protein LOC115676704 isoform X2 [Syzygium oleosum]